MLEPAKAVEFFRKVAEPQSFAQGAPIFSQNEIGLIMYGIVEGEVDLLVNGKVMETLYPGDVFGEGALVQPDQTRASTAIAKIPCKLVFIDQERFLFLIQETPLFALQVIRSLSTRLRQFKHRA